MTTSERVRPPRPYHRPQNRWWWLHNIRYTRFMLQEVSALFLAVFGVVYLAQAAMLLAGPAAYQSFLAAVASPGWLAFHALVFVFALIHTLTWLWLGARVLEARIGTRRLPVAALLAAGVVVWLALSVGIALVLLAG